MDENELEQFVTDKLVMANSVRDNIPDWSMLCCRKALEKISIYLHIKFFGKKPSEEGRSQSITQLKPELKPGSHKLMKHVWGKSSSYLHEKDPPVTPRSDHVGEMIGEIERLYLSEIGTQLHWEPITVPEEYIIEEIMENVRGENIQHSEEGLNDLLQSLRAAGVLSESNPKFSLKHLLDLGNAAYLLGNYELSESYYEKARLEASLTGDRGAEAKALTSLGAIANSRGDIEMAKRLQEATLRIARENGDSEAEGIALLNLAGHAFDTGQMNVAEDLIGQANKKLGGTNRELTDGYKPDFDAEIYLILGNIAWKRAHDPQWRLMSKDYHIEEAQLNWREYVRIRNQYGLKLQDWFYKIGWTDPDGDWDLPPDES